MPRPRIDNPKTSRIQIRIAQDMDLKLAAHSKKTYRSKSSIVVEALDQYFMRLEDNVSKGLYKNKFMLFEEIVNQS